MQTFFPGYRSGTETLVPVGAAINAIIWADWYELVAAFLWIQAFHAGVLPKKNQTPAEDPPSESVTMSKCSHLH